MFVPAKQIPLHPSRIHNLREGEILETPSGMGGSFSIRFEGYAATRAHFVIVSSSPPPDGWNGEKRTFPIEDLPSKVSGIAPECPFLDDGRAEIIMRAKLGYPVEGEEISKLLHRFPINMEKVKVLDRYFELHSQLTKASRIARHRAAALGVSVPYTRTQEPIVREMEAIEQSFILRRQDYFNRYHKLWLALRQPEGWIQQVNTLEQKQTA